MTTIPFRADDPRLADDPVFGTKLSLLCQRGPGEGPDGPFEFVRHTFVMDHLP